MEKRNPLLVPTAHLASCATRGYCATVWLQVVLLLVTVDRVAYAELDEYLTASRRLARGLTIDV